jgi:hypothetical protein
MFSKKNYLILLAVLVNFILSSCATIINGETQEIKITIDSNITKFKIYDSLNTNTTYYKSNTYEVLRSEKPLYLRVQFDTTIKTVRIEPHTSLAYYLNILNYGLGYWAEKDIPQKYSYPGKIKLEVKDSLLSVKSSSASDAGMINLDISMPYINTFYL